MKETVITAYKKLAYSLLHAAAANHPLAAGTLDALLTTSEICRYTAERVICRRGDVVTDLIVVLEGCLEVSMESQDGRRSICWYLNRGQWMGLISVIDGRGAVHNLRAHGEAVLLHIPRPAFLQALQNDSGLAKLCLEVLCDRSRMLYDNLAAESLLPLRGRVAKRLLLLQERHGRAEGQNVAITLKLSQDQFADMLGITRQSLNRQLKALAALGMISVAYSQITVLDLQGLQALASVDVVDPG